MKKRILFSLLLLSFCFIGKASLPIKPTVNINKVATPALDKTGNKILNTWDITLSVTTGKGEKYIPVATDVVLVIDCSSSMEQNGRITAAKQAAQTFVKQLLPTATASSGFTRIALVSYNSTLNVNQDFTKDPNILINNIKALTTKPGTFTQGGIHKARELLKASTAPNKHIVLLTDGIAREQYHIKNIKSNDFETKENSAPLVAMVIEGAMQAPANYVKDYSKGGVTKPTNSSKIAKDDLAEAKYDYTRERDYLESGVLLQEKKFGTSPPYYYFPCNAAINEANFAKDAGMTIHTVALDLRSLAVGEESIKRMATHGCYYTAVPSELIGVFKEIAKEVDIAMNKPVIEDIMASGIVLQDIHTNEEILYGNIIDKVNASKGTAIYDYNTKKITWQLGTVPPEKTYSLTYRVFLDISGAHGIPVLNTISQQGPDIGWYDTNYRATLTYKDITNETQKMTFPQPTVKPFIDTDKDGVSDEVDLDDDNDGILDCVENNLTGRLADIMIPAGSAKIVGNNIVLTEDRDYQSGQVWSTSKADFRKSFQLKMKAKLGTNDEFGADGIAIVFHNDPNQQKAHGADGSGLGALQIKNGIVLELDTYYNPTQGGDIPQDHGHIWLSQNLTRLTTPVELPNLEDGNWHSVIINWDAITGTLTYRVDNIVAGSYVNKNIINQVFNGNNLVVFGFTASTGRYKNRQEVQFSNLCTDLPLVVDTDKDGIPDYLDLDSDNDGCPDAKEGGDNVTDDDLVEADIDRNTGVTKNLGNDVGTTPNVDYGVPRIVNPGGRRDKDGKVGQSIHLSKDKTKDNCVNYWIGTPTSNDWNIPTNWTAGEVPLPGKKIEFATEANNPTKAGIPTSGPAKNDLHVPGRAGTPTIIGDLVNQSDKNLVVPAEKAIQIEGNIVGSSRPEDARKIQILSAPGKPNGSFLVNSPVLRKLCPNTNIYGTVYMYAKGKKYPERTWQDNIPGSPTINHFFKSKYAWQHFGIPVDRIKAEPTFYKSYLREYHEDSNGDNTTFYQKWTNLNNNSVLEAFKGYEITQDEPTTYMIQGKLQLCDKQLVMTRKAPPVKKATGDNVHYGLGQNIFGNSYTAGINVNEIKFPVWIEQTVYLYNTGTFVEWGEKTENQLNPGDRAIAGQYTAIPSNVPVAFGGVIPSMNGFLLRFSKNYTRYNEPDVAVSLLYEEVVVENRKPQTAPKANLAYLEIGLESKSTIDKLWLVSQDGTTEGFDNGWDGHKFFGTPTAFIYSETLDGNMQVNTTETLDNKIISFYPNNDVDYSLSLKKFDLDKYKNLTLLDLEARRAIPLKDATTIYHFKANKANVATKRFKLVDSADGNFDIINKNLSRITIEQIENRILVTNNTPNNGVIQVLDLTGKLVASERMNRGLNNYDFHLTQGTYIVKGNTDTDSTQIKIIIR